MLKSHKAKNRWTRAREQMDLTPAGVAKTDSIMAEEFENNGK